MLLFASCSEYRSGPPAERVCFTFRIDYDANVTEDVTVIKVLDLSSGQTLFSTLGSAFYFDDDGLNGTIAIVRNCTSVASTGTKKVIAFYGRGEFSPRAECVGAANIDSNACMPRPGDVVAETHVDIAEGDDLTIRLTMGESE